MRKIIEALKSEVMKGSWVCVNLDNITHTNLYCDKGSEEYIFTPPIKGTYRHDLHATTKKEGLNYQKLKSIGSWQSEISLDRWDLLWEASTSPECRMSSVYKYKRIPNENGIIIKRGAKGEYMVIVEDVNNKNKLLKRNITNIKEALCL